jgi:hypothetical protein
MRCRPEWYQEQEYPQIPITCIKNKMESPHYISKCILILRMSTTLVSGSHVDSELSS